MNRKSFIQKASSFAAVLIVQLSMAYAQEVQVNLRAKMDPMPPQVMNYISTPGNYFDVQLINTSDQALNVFITIDVKQKTGGSQLHLWTPNNIQPNTPITLAPSQTLLVNPSLLQQQFRQLDPSQVYLEGGKVSDFYDTGIVGLLPEGDYEAQIMVYRWDLASSAPQVLSNSLSGKCSFTICYSADAPLFLTPAYNSFDADFKSEDEKWKAAIVDPNDFRLTWMVPVMKCNGANRSYNYQLNIYPIGPTMVNPEEAVVLGTKAKSFKLSSNICPVTPIEVAAIKRFATKDSPYFVAQVVATPTITNKDNMYYSTISNNGRSNLLVFRFKSEPEPIAGEGTTPEEEEEKKEPVVVPIPDAELFKFKPAKITAPEVDKNVWGPLLYAAEEPDIELKWNSPSVTARPEGNEDEITYTYDVLLFKKELGQTLDDVTQNDTLFSKKDLNVRTHTIKWSDISKKVKVGDNLVIAVAAKPTNVPDSLAIFDEDHTNMVQMTVSKQYDEKYCDCYSGADAGITNRELAILSEKELRGREVMIGGFPLTIENASIVKKKYYKGEGYVTWKPVNDVPVKIAVEFDSLWINSADTVYMGEVRSAKVKDKTLSSYIPYDMFDDWGLANLIGSGTGQQYGEKLDQYLQDNSSIKKYYEYARESAEVITIAKNLFKSEVGPVHLPISLPKVIDTSPVDIQILSANFSPTNASLNITAMLALPESEYIDNQVAVFGAPRCCIRPDEFAPDGITMALLADFTLVDPSSGFAFRLKAPTNFDTLDDGCAVTFSDNGLDSLTFEAQMTIPGLIKADDKGKAIGRQMPAVTIRAFIKDWDNWLGTLAMDNFQVEGADGFTFVPGGEGGISYDHSLTHNPKGFSVDSYGEKYDKEKAGIKNDNILTWKGLFIDEIGIMMPPIWSKDDAPLTLAMKKFIYDEAETGGVTFAVANKGSLIDVNTESAGGWGIGLDEVGVNVIQSDFSDCFFKGYIKAPLIGGKWKYTASLDMIDHDHSGKNDDLRIQFKTEPEENPSFDFFIAELELDKDYTNFALTSCQDETDVELNMTGKITIAGLEDVTKNLPMDMNISGVGFYGMRLANYAPDKEKAKNTGAASLKFAHTFDPICEGEKKGDLWFDLGTWGLASPEKTLGPFKFALDDFGVKMDGGKAGVNIVGTIGLVGDVFAATAGVTIWADISKVKDLDISYAGVTLDEIGIHSEFGGCKVDGDLKFTNIGDKIEGSDEKSTKKGFSGTLDIALPGDLFDVKCKGGFYNMKDEEHGKWTSASFVAELGGKAGVPLGPVMLNNIAGGFYFNTKVTKSDGNDPIQWEDEPCYGIHGGMFGLGICTAGTDRGMNAKVKMIVTYDAVHNKLSTIRMNGEVHALCAADASSGLINGECSIVYQNLSSAEGGKYFQLNITADAGADMNDLYKEFTGKEFKLPDMTAGLEGLEDENSKDPNKKNKDAKESKSKIGCEAHISLDIKVTMRPDDLPEGTPFNTKWHVYVGQPGDGTPESEQKNRCSITLIDFQVGGKNDPVAVWGKIWANAYICIGNELPNNGELPPIPQEIQEFLDGGDANGKKQSLSGTAEAKRKASVADFQGGVKTGVMFGAQAGGEFGVNAVICYANASLMAGFDIILKQLAPGTRCNGKPAGGDGGFYGMGQVYALAKGEMGLMLNLWIFSGKIPLIDVGLGALLKGGFPNPSWAYGKVRAKCKLFGGLIKFNGSLSFEVGEVCFPDAGNPLDDVQIFEDITPGNEEKENGWDDDKNLVSPYATPGFSTNMKMFTILPLVDENRANRMAGKDGDPDEYAALAARYYKFYLDPTVTISSYDDAGNVIKSESYSYSSYDQQSYTVLCPRFEEKTCYTITAGGYVKEIRGGQEVDPIFNDSLSGYKDVHRAWSQKETRYFRTDELPVELTNDVEFMRPSLDYYDTWTKLKKPIYDYIDEYRHPMLVLNGERNGAGSTFDESKYKTTARIERYDEKLYRWLPLDAVTVYDVYDGHPVSNQSDIDWFTSVDASGAVTGTQLDPFAGATFAYMNTGLAGERLQRYTAEFGNLLGSMAADSDRQEFASMLWVPESFSSLIQEVNYYILLAKENNILFSRQQQLKQFLTRMESEEAAFQKGNIHYTPTIDDIQYICTSTRTLDASAATAVDGYMTQLQQVMGQTRMRMGTITGASTAEEAGAVHDELLTTCEPQAQDIFYRAMNYMYLTPESNSFKDSVMVVMEAAGQAESLQQGIKAAMACRGTAMDAYDKTNLYIGQARGYDDDEQQLQWHLARAEEACAAAGKAAAEAAAAFPGHNYAEEARMYAKAAEDSVALFRKSVQHISAIIKTAEYAEQAEQIYQEAVEYLESYDEAEDWSEVYATIRNYADEAQKAADEARKVSSSEPSTTAATKFADKTVALLNNDSIACYQASYYADLAERAADNARLWAANALKGSSASLQEDARTRATTYSNEADKQARAAEKLAGKPRTEEPIARAKAAAARAQEALTEKLYSYAIVLNNATINGTASKFTNKTVKNHLTENGVPSTIADNAVQNPPQTVFSGLSSSAADVKLKMLKSKGLDVSIRNYIDDSRWETTAEVADVLYRLTLNKTHGNEPSVAGAIYKAMHIELSEARDSLRTLPLLVSDRLSYEEASDLATKLSKYDADYDLRVSELTTSTLEAYDQAMAAAEAAKTHYEVVITAFDATYKVRLINAISDVTNMGSVAAKTLVNSPLPLVVKTFTDSNEASEFKSRLDTAITNRGTTATTSIREVPGATASALPPSWAQYEPAVLYASCLPSVAEAREPAEPAVVVRTTTSTRTADVRNVDTGSLINAATSRLNTGSLGTAALNTATLGTSSPRTGTILNPETTINAVKPTTGTVGSRGGDIVLPSTSRDPSVIPGTSKAGGTIVIDVADRRDATELGIKSGIVDKQIEQEIAAMLPHGGSSSSSVNTANISGSTAAEYLNSILTNTGHNGNNYNKRGYHVDGASYKGTKMTTIPISYLQKGNYNWVMLDADLFETLGVKSLQYYGQRLRIVFERTDLRKLEAYIARIDSIRHEEQNRAIGEKSLYTDKGDNSFLADSYDEPGRSDEVDLQAYMAQYYQEMNALGMNADSATTAQAKLENGGNLDDVMSAKIYEVEFYMPIYMSPYNNFHDAMTKGERTILGVNTTTMEGSRPVELVWSNRVASDESLMTLNGDPALFGLSALTSNPNAFLISFAGYTLFGGHQLKKCDFSEFDGVTIPSVSFHYPKGGALFTGSGQTDWNMPTQQFSANPATVINDHAIGYVMPSRGAVYDYCIKNGDYYPTAALSYSLEALDIIADSLNDYVCNAIQDLYNRDVGYGTLKSLAKKYAGQNHIVTAYGWSAAKTEEYAMKVEIPMLNIPVLYGSMYRLDIEDHVIGLKGSGFPNANVRYQYGGLTNRGTDVRNWTGMSAGRITDPYAWYMLRRNYSLHYNALYGRMAPGGLQKVKAEYFRFDAVDKDTKLPAVYDEDANTYRTE